MQERQIAAFEAEFGRLRSEVEDLEAVEGWLLDVYPGKDGEMVAWLKKDDGATVRLTDSLA